MLIIPHSRYCGDMWWYYVNVCTTMFLPSFWKGKKKTIYLLLTFQHVLLALSKLGHELHQMEQNQVVIQREISKDVKSRSHSLKTLAVHWLFFRSTWTSLYTRVTLFKLKLHLAVAATYKGSVVGDFLRH